MAFSLRQGSDALMEFQRSLCQCQSKADLLDYARDRHAHMTQGEAKVDDEDLVLFILESIRAQLETILSLLNEVSTSLHPAKEDDTETVTGTIEDDSDSSSTADASGDPMIPVLRQLGRRSGNDIMDTAV